MVALTVVLRGVRGWFARLNNDAQLQPSETLLEDPTSIKRVRAPSLQAEATKSLSIIIPAYNEEGRLPLTLEETLRCDNVSSSSEMMRFNMHGEVSHA